MQPHSILASILLFACVPLGASAQVMPHVFQHPQLLFQADHYVATANGRPGDGIRHRLPKGWKALSKTRTTEVVPQLPAIRRLRALDHLYYPVSGGTLLEFRDRAGFCAWAKERWVQAVTFMDWGGAQFGEKDCQKPLEYYQKVRYRPASEDPSLDPNAIDRVDPFAGRPSDAMYGDHFELTVSMQQQRARIDAGGNPHIEWKPLEAGASAEGQGQIRFHLGLSSDDVLPLKILQIRMATNCMDRGNWDNPMRVEEIGLPPETDLPLMVSPGDSYRTTFLETARMSDIGDQVVQVFFVVDFEGPTGSTDRRVASTHYWKAAW